MKASEVVSRLAGAGVINAQQESLWLMAHALGVGNAAILARDEFSPDETRRIDAVISRRVAGEPLQYILGEADFYGRDFAVGPGVLIPRHDTETLIDGVKKIFSRDDAFRFLDWGTGTGCIAITILLEFPNATGVMVDASTEALSYAKRNIQRYGLTHRAVTGNVAGEFDIIVSNPPYIPTREIPGLSREVRHEPILALDGGIDGMDCYREIFAAAMTGLKHGGYLILEAGNWEQARELESYSSDFVSAGRILDGGNFPRCIILRRV